VIEVVANIEIDAPADVVWRALVELDRFHDWNPFIREASGSSEIGGTVWVRVATPLGIRLRFRATVLDREPARELRWKGHVLAPWLAAGEHWFTIEPIAPDRVRFVQREKFSGIVPRLGARLLAREARRGFDAMNRALKARAEAFAHAPPVGRTDGESMRVVRS
jgi:hypothetical protein